MARRHSLLTRLLAMSVVVAGCSIGATAWLAAQSTSGAITQELGESLATDAKIYDALLSHAATHPRWSGVQRVVDDLSEQTGRRITLTTSARVLIASSGDAPADPLPRTPSAVVDPLAVDAALKPDAATSGIDPRAVGPYRLTDAERDETRRQARDQQACLHSHGQAAELIEGPSRRFRAEAVIGAGREVPPGPIPAVTTTYEPPSAPVDMQICTGFVEPTRTELDANDKLLKAVNACLSRQGKEPLTVQTNEFTSPEELHTGSDAERCVESARREQLAPYVSPPAQLFITAPGGNTATTDLSTVGMSRIAWTAAAVLVLTIGVTALAARRLVHPIDAITAAVRRIGGGDRSARVQTGARGEIGELASAFNKMSDQIERSEQQRKTMVSDIAHELRTPLANVRGWLEAAQEGVVKLDQPRLTSLVQETVLLQHLIDDLQDLALADAGKLRVHPEPVHVAAILEQVAAAHRSRAESEGVEVRVIVDDEPELTADPSRLRQALGNLVSNAVRYTSSGGQVTLWARPSGAEVLIDVSDTGAGIDAESLPHIFDRFWRADKSRGRGGGGSGLGLAITHHLIDIHGGRIEVHSTVGVGTTFTIHLSGAVSRDRKPYG